MAVGQERLNTIYGFPGPLDSLPLPTLVMNRQPTPQDYGIPSQQWLDISVTPSVMYYMSNNAAGLYNWVVLTSSGSSGIFGNLSVTPGPVTLVGTANINSTGTAVTHIGNTTGNTFVAGTLTSTLGLTAGSSVIAGTGITATTGNISATAGNVLALAGALIGEAVSVTGDLGGVASETVFTNVNVPVAGGTGAFTITSATTAGAATNAGFIKVYVGVTAVYIPYFTTTA